MFRCPACQAAIKPKAVRAETRRRVRKHQVIQLRRRGYTWAEIGARLNCSTTFAWTIGQEAGL